MYRLIADINKVLINICVILILFIRIIVERKNRIIKNLLLFGSTVADIKCTFLAKTNPPKKDKN